MQVPPGIAYALDQLGAGLERSQAIISQLQQQVAELEAENTSLRQQLPTEETK